MSSSEKYRVMFVDDEKLILSGLKRMLHGLRSEWEMLFVESGASALSVLEEREGQIDAVISDMRMPGMDGAALLTQVRDKYPHALRIILSGHAEVEAAMRSSCCAHQFLSKPCDSNQVKGVVARALERRGRTRSDSVRAVVGKLHNLPSLPSIYGELSTAMADENSTAKTLADIVSKDSAIAVKVLQLVNSSFFGVPRVVDSLDRAVSYLGLSNLRALVLSYGMVREFDAVTAAPSFDMEAHQAHSLAVANLSRLLLAGDKPAQDLAFLGGILHDVGRLVVATNFREEYELIERATRDAGQSDQEIEMQVLGATRADIGAHLLGIWGMSETLAEVVQCQVQPATSVEESFGPVTAVHVAISLLHELANPEQPGRMDLEWIERLGVSDRLTEWRDFASSVVEMQQQDAA